MKKRSGLILLSLVTILALCLTACSGGSQEEKPNLNSEKGVQNFLEGEWLSTEGGYRYTFDGKGKSTFTDKGGTYEGKYTVDGDKIEVFEDGKKEDTGHLKEDGRLMMDSCYDGWYYKKGAEEIPATAYGKQIAFQPNMDFDEGSYTMENGGSYVGKGGNPYGVGDVRWEITPDGTYMDEFDTNAFKVVGLFPVENAPQGSKLQGSGSFVFYDYHTGRVLPLTKEFKGKKDWYVFDYDTNGGHVHLEIRMEERHEGADESFADTVSYIFEVNKPDWYEGLVMSFIPQPATYAEKEKLDSFSYYQSGMKIGETGLDMENALKCIIV